jgi:hypothetical protein
MLQNAFPLGALLLDILLASYQFNLSGAWSPAGCELSPSELVALAGASAATLTALDLSHAHIARKDNRADVAATAAWLRRRGLADEHESEHPSHTQQAGSGGGGMTTSVKTSAGQTCAKDDQMSSRVEAATDADMLSATNDLIVVDASSIATLLLVLNCNVDVGMPYSRQPFSALTKLSLDNCTGLCTQKLNRIICTVCPLFSSQFMH